MTPALGTRSDPLNGATEPTPVLVRTLPPPVAQIGASLASLLTAAFAGLPPEWPDQARIQVALELARYVAGGPLANQLVPQQGFMLPPSSEPGGP